MNILIDNLALRPLNTTDGKGFFELIDRNRVRLRDFFPLTVSIVLTEENSNSYVAEKLEQAAKKEFYSFVLEDANGNLQGYISLKNINWSVPKCELAYFIDSGYEGRGIMTQALAAVVKHGFDALGMNKLYLTTAADNLPSRRMVEKNGFEAEGILRKDFKHSSGALVDMVYYGLIRQEPTTS